MMTIAEIEQQQLNQPRPQMTGEEWRKWCLKMVDLHWEAEWAKATKAGDGKPCLFLPFLGEFGHRWMYHVRRVHFSTATRKVVCIQPGEEAMYPTATEFFYEWQHPLDDNAREGTDRIYRDWTQLRFKFPDLFSVQGGGLCFDLERRCIAPTERMTFTPKARGLMADVCIGTRARGLNPRQNWTHCQLIANACKARGLTFATIAHPAVGYHLDGEVCMSGDYADIDAPIELIQNCRFYFGQDSGVAHMVSTIGKPMAVLTVPHRIWMEEEAKKTGLPIVIQGRDFVDRMIDVNAPHCTTRIAPEKWFSPEEVVKDFNVAMDAIISPARMASPTTAKSKSRGGGSARRKQFASR
jgi:hypothetical protein